MDATATTQERERKTQYDRGHEEAVEKFTLILSMCIDFYPAAPSASTLALLGPENAALCDTVVAQLRRFAANVKRNKTAAEAAA